MPVWRQFSGWNLSLFQTEKNAIGCRELQARGKCSKEDASNCEQMGNAGKKARPITSKKEMLKGRHVQLRANGTCSQEGRSIMSKSELLEGRCAQSSAKGNCSKEEATNREQKGNVGKRVGPITSKREMLARRRVQLRAKEKCSQDGAFNYEQKGNAQRKTRPIASKWGMLEGGPAQL